jgi:DNA-binding beta-propeller fold protein YncE
MVSFGSMRRRKLVTVLRVLFSAGVFLALFGCFESGKAQQFERPIEARARVFPEVGPGVRALRRNAAGLYYILTAGTVGVYDSKGKRVAQVPAAAANDSSLVFGDDLDVDSAGQLYVADRAGNAVKVFDVDGKFLRAIPIPAPTSVVALPNGEIAVASLNSKLLVEVFNSRGRVAREFGDPSDLAGRPDLNRFLNIGRLAADAEGHLYYAFTYMPEPTIRKYDRYGYALLDVSLSTLETAPGAQALRREIVRQDERGGTPTFNPVINAIGVDRDTQEIWVALGDQLLLFDREGNRHANYRTFTAEGARVEATAILVEPDRLLLAADPLGIFEFARPDKLARTAP